MNGSLQYLLVQKVAEAEHQQRVAENMARAARSNGESGIYVQFRRIVSSFHLNLKPIHERPSATPCVEMANSSQPC